MNITEATIEVKRNGGILSSISVVMPVWVKKEEDGHLSIKIPLLGLSTWAETEEESEVAIEEAIHSFCIACEKFGHGLEDEIQNLGWERTTEENDSNLLNHKSDSDIIHQIMETGDQFAYENLMVSL